LINPIPLMIIGNIIFHSEGIVPTSRTLHGYLLDAYISHKNGTVRQKFTNHLLTITFQRAYNCYRGEWAYGHFQHH
jgi:hypothetical protein